MRQLVGSVLVGIASVLLSFGQARAEPLASWNEGAAKRAIIELVEATSTPASPAGHPPAPSPLSNPN